MTDWPSEPVIPECVEICAEVRSLTAERDRYRAALEEVRDKFPPVTPLMMEVHAYVSNVLRDAKSLT